LDRSREEEEVVGYDDDEVGEGGSRRELKLA
jgi:hypothetical protein